MEDIERYGDYNEIDEAPGGQKNPVAIILKIVVLSVCVLVVGILAFRVILFNYYPDFAKDIYFNDELKVHYELAGDDFSAKTQTLRAPYDDPDFASFFCDNLIVVEQAGQLQLSLRYNSSVFDTIESKYGVRLDEDVDGLFDFALERVMTDGTAQPYEIGKLAYESSDSLLMYTYYKLVFDDIDAEHFSDGSWIRLRITLRDVAKAKPYYVLVYENTDEYNKFQDYTVKGREIP